MIHEDDSSSTLQIDRYSVQTALARPLSLLDRKKVVTRQTAKELCMPTGAQPHRGGKHQRCSVAFCDQVLGVITCVLLHLYPK